MGKVSLKDLEVVCKGKHQLTCDANLALAGSFGLGPSDGGPELDDFDFKVELIARSDLAFKASLVDPG